jgi:hypothetical protein
MDRYLGKWAINHPDDIEAERKFQEKCHLPPPRPAEIYRWIDDPSGENKKGHWKVDEKTKWS